VERSASFALVKLETLIYPRLYTGK